MWKSGFSPNYLGGLTVMFLLLLALAGCAAPKHMPVPSPDINTKTANPLSPPSGVRAVSVEEVKRKLSSGEPVILVDVRPKAAFEKSSIPGAVSAPLEELAYRQLELDINSEVIVFTTGDCVCDTAGSEAGQLLVEKGFNHVTELAGGFSTWQREGNPIVSR
jgi:rhodanese-related sulfurtransferase